jgi:hypothetical protein
MRIPDKILDLPAFLCVDVKGRFRMAGTAFFLGLRGPSPLYLVTARHCIQKAQAYGDLYIRLNKHGGGVETVRLEGTWYYSESGADDIAVMPIPSTTILAFDIWPIEIPVWCASDEVIRSEDIGVGDEVVTAGLFTHRDGKHQNQSILRSGIISAMPNEPLEDINSGLMYDAYLVEIRSMGGLSGSPVFVALPPGRVNKGKFEMDRLVFWLLGVVRGHWTKQPSEFADFGEAEQIEFNTGIAIVTPIQKAVSIIMNTEELVKERKALARKDSQTRTPKEDSVLGGRAEGIYQG